jgi:uncharacterized protein (TIGR02246 family)
MSVEPDVERTVTQIIDRYLTAWNDKDHEALSAFFDSAGDLVAADGEYSGNADQIREYYRGQLEGPYGEIKLRNPKLRNVRSVHDGVFVADAGWEAFMSSSSQTSDPIATPMGTFVLSPTGGTWHFLAVRIMVPFRAN